MYIIIQFKINVIIRMRILYYTRLRILVLNVAFIDNIKLEYLILNV